MEVDKTGSIIARPLTKKEALFMIKLFHADSKQEVDNIIYEHKKLERGN